MKEVGYWTEKLDVCSQSSSLSNSAVWLLLPVPLLPAIFQTDSMSKNAENNCPVMQTCFEHEHPVSNAANINIWPNFHQWAIGWTTTMLPHLVMTSDVADIITKKIWEICPSVYFFLSQSWESVQHQNAAGTPLCLCELHQKGRLWQSHPVH